MADLPSSRPDFPPLLPPGFHDYTIERLRVLCVDGFALSRRRGAIMDGLEQVVRALLDVGIEGELWVNGSFVTAKIDPADVDIVLRVPGAFHDNANPDQRRVIDWVGDGLRDSHHCDSYVFHGWPEWHPLHAVSERIYAYWSGWYGTNADGTLKGIAVISLSGGGAHA